MADEPDSRQVPWPSFRHAADEQRYVLAQMQSGKLNPNRVAMAAALGYNGARVPGVTVTDLPKHYRSRIGKALAALSNREIVGFAADCSSHIVHVWESAFPKDPRPREAIEAARLWLVGKASEDLIAPKGKAAADAAIAADRPDEVPANAPLTAAIHAADSASHTALATEYAARVLRQQTPGVGGVHGCAAFAASFGVSASNTPEMEREWQIARLIDYLLNRVESVL
jgi:hypothetical protein